MNLEMIPIGSKIRTHTGEVVKVLSKDIQPIAYWYCEDFDGKGIFVNVKHIEGVVDESNSR
jgi:hypothetical protein